MTVAMRLGSNTGGACFVRPDFSLPFAVLLTRIFHIDISTRVTLFEALPVGAALICAPQTL